MSLLIIWSSTMTKSHIVTVSPFGVNDPFSVKSLYALEAAGVPVVTSITENFKQFCKLCKLSHSSYQSCSQAIEEWEENVETPPTWRHLFDVLKQMDLEELVQEIENYLGSRFSVAISRI